MSARTTGTACIPPDLEFLPAEYIFIGDVGCITFIFALRAAVIYWNLSVPDWLVTKPKRI